MTLPALTPDPRDALLARYAMPSSATRGRVHPEPGHPYRNPYQRDRDRIVHSSAFRRLAHKTQVFIGEMGDYHRTRLTHTLEVASIARTIGRTLRLNEDLIEALALAHDIGHPPFGHAGEDVLNDCLKHEGGFNHNQQALRIMELLEIRYPDFRGLNLSYELLMGQRVRAESRSRSALPVGNQRALGTLLEVQVVDAADSIAYDAHDADDAVELGLLSLEELGQSGLWRGAADRARRRYAALSPLEFRRATVHELIDTLVSDLLATSCRRIDEVAWQGPQEVIAAGSILIGPSQDIGQQKSELEQLLFHRVYRHRDVLEQRERAGNALYEMFAWGTADPERIPQAFHAIIQTEGPSRAVADFLASMTDRMALETHASHSGLADGKMLKWLS
jgi:dGTPase